MRSILFITRVDRTYFIMKMLKYMRKNFKKVRLIVISDDEWNPCRPIVDHFVYLPKNEKNSEKFIKNVINAFNIKGVFVASNFDLILLQNISSWLDKHQILYYGPHKTSLKICLSKYEQHIFLESIGVRTPHVYTYEEIMYSREKSIFPIIIKPIYGQGSTGVFLINDKEELLSQSYNEDILLQEKIEGIEYTIDCFTNKRGELLLNVPRIRSVISGSHSVVAKIQLNKELHKLALKINDNIRIFGPWNFQLFQTEKGFIVHDINPRIASGIIFSLSAGAPFDEMIVNHLVEDRTEQGKEIKTQIKDGMEIYTFNACTNADFFI